MASEPTAETSAAVGRLLRRVAADEIMPRFRHLADSEVREKKPGDFVTIADEAAERALTDALKALVPDSVVVGEEAVAGDATVLARLGEAAPVWVVDPLDGTRFFAHGETGFTVMVAYVQAGVTQGAWIYDPVGDRLAAARAGAGAYLDGERIQIQAPDGLAQTAAHFSLPLASSGWKRAIRQRAGDYLRRDVRGKAAGMSYLGLLTGHHHAAFFQKLAPWDHAAGVLLHTEAGGHARLLSGEAYDPRRPRNDAADGLLLAANAAQWQALATTVLAPPAED